MKSSSACTISVVVPLYNESGALQDFHRALTSVLAQSVGTSYEIIYCDDGSTDQTAHVVQQFCQADVHTKLLKLTRNFGKENALTAGIAQATAKAILTLDGDGQHPVELIPKFISAWEHGAQVVVGVRQNHPNNNRSKWVGRQLFYGVFNRISAQKLIAGSTDFRLIDQAVQQAFLQLPETNRITRGLIDWLGFETVRIPFRTKTRVSGEPGYSFKSLVQLALNSLVSLSPAPLYIFGLSGVVITVLAFLLGASVFVEQLLLGDPWHWKFTGTAMLSILLLFLVGILLSAQGLLSLYVSHIHSQSKQRPLYVIDYRGSAGIDTESSGNA
ncbi:MAG: glycosyltransferase family protein [Candidatus Saccharibacteria bacterium]|nr:glycosyltransferase family protein [Candidatus Saccharibacteria bacterium]